MSEKVEKVEPEKELVLLKEELAKTRAVNASLLAEMANAYKVASQRADELLQIKDKTAVSKQQVDELMKQMGIFFNKVLAIEHKISEPKAEEKK
jgi:hypothetical protein